MIRVRSEYADLDKRLNIAEAKRDFIKVGGFEQVEYLINQFPK